MTIVLFFIQLAVTVTVGIYFFMQLRKEKNAQPGVKRESAREYENLRRMRSVSLTRSLSEHVRPKVFEDIVGQEDGIHSLKAILCGAADEVDTEVMLKIMAVNGRIDIGLPLVPNTLSLNSFRFDALLAVDREKYAPIILDELDRDYLRMLRAGATSFWEDSLGADAYGGAGSLCHGWSALPIYYYEILLD